MTVELGPGIDRYLASVRLAPAVVDVDGSLVFQVEERLQIHVAMLPDERLELFAGAGYVRAELLQAIVEADEDDFILAVDGDAIGLRHRIFPFVGLRGEGTRRTDRQAIVAHQHSDTRHDDAGQCGLEKTTA